MKKRILTLVSAALFWLGTLCPALASAAPADALSPQYILAYPFENGLARAEKDLKWGALSPDGAVKIPFTWDYLGEESDSLMLVLLRQPIRFHPHGRLCSRRAGLRAGLPL